MVTKLFGNMTCGVLRAIVKPNQGNTIILEAMVSHARDAPPLHHLLNFCGINALHELNELFKTHLNMLGPTVTIMLGEILTRRNSRGLKQMKPLI